MSDHVVNREAGGEGNTALNFLGLLGVVDLAESGLNISVNGLADGVNISVFLAKLNSIGEGG